MFRSLFTIAVLTSTLPAAIGQTRNFALTIPPIASIQALSGPQTMTHPMTRGNLNFLDSQWQLNCNLAAGATVQFTAPTFQNDADPSFQRDVQLRLQSFTAAPGSGWAYADRADRSRYSNGMTSATVSMASSGPGTASVNLRVRFITENDPVGRLPGGNYSTTVIGTITAN